MSETFGPPTSEQPKKSNSGTIIVVVVVLLLCCCCTIIGGYFAIKVAIPWLWENGDSIFGTGALLLQMLK